MLLFSIVLTTTALQGAARPVAGLSQADFADKPVRAGSAERQGAVDSAESRKAAESAEKRVVRGAGDKFVVVDTRPALVEPVHLVADKQ